MAVGTTSKPLSTPSFSKLILSSIEAGEAREARIPHAPPEFSIIPPESISRTLVEAYLHKRSLDPTIRESIIKSGERVKIKPGAYGGFVITGFTEKTREVLERYVGGEASIYKFAEEGEVVELGSEDQLKLLEALDPLLKDRLAKLIEECTYPEMSLRRVSFEEARGRFEIVADKPHYIVVDIRSPTSSYFDAYIIDISITNTKRRLCPVADKIKLYKRKDGGKIPIIVSDYHRAHIVLVKKPTAVETDIEVNEGVANSIEPEEELELEDLGGADTRESEPTAVETGPKLVKVWLLAMSLPSRDLAARYELTKFKAIKDWGEEEKHRREIASKLEGIRRKYYEEIARRWVYVDEVGLWMGASDDSPRLAWELNQKLKNDLEKLVADLIKLGKKPQLDRYEIKPLEAYFPVETAKWLLKIAIRKLMSDIEKLEEAIRRYEMEEKIGKVRQMMKRKEAKEIMLEWLKRELARLG